MYRLWLQLALHGYNGFNLLALDFSPRECFWSQQCELNHPPGWEKGILACRTPAWTPSTGRIRMTENN